MFDARVIISKENDLDYLHLKNLQINENGEVLFGAAFVTAEKKS